VQLGSSVGPAYILPASLQATTSLISGRAGSEFVLARTESGQNGGELASRTALLFSYRARLSSAPHISGVELWYGEGDARTNPLVE
jgi:hypothetical protein